MLCNLSEIASALAQTYSIETYGMMEVPVRSICRITPATPFASAVETLYVGTPSDLEAMPINQNLTAFPFLCITDQHPQEWNRYLYTSMKTIVLVHNQLLGDVLARLAEIMFQLGQQSAPTPPLYHTLLGCQNPVAMLNAAVESMNRPAVLLNRGNQVLHAATDQRTAMFLKKLKDLCPFYPNVSALLSSSVQEVTLATGGVKARLAQAEDLLIYCFPIEDSKGHEAGFLLIPEQTECLSETVVEDCLILRRFLSMELLLHAHAAASEDTIEQLLRAIFHAELTDQTELQYLLDSLHWRPKCNLYVITFSNGGQVPSIPFYDSLEIYLRLLPGSHGFIDRGHVILLYETDRVLETEQSQSLLTPLRTHLMNHQLHGGVSQVFHRLQDLRKYYLQAYQATELGMVFGPDRALHWYDAYSIYQLLRLAATQTELTAFATDGFRRLNQWDQDTGGELIKTLDTYLRCRGNVAQCAKAMYLHVNTVKYRVSKIEELLQFSLSDGERFFQLYLSMKAFHYSQYMGQHL